MYIELGFTNHVHKLTAPVDFSPCTFQVNSLEAPWGNCTKKNLEYFDEYSVTTCQMDCENVLARRECGCRDINMPKKGES